MAQNIIYRPWRGTKDPWLCLLTKLLSFCLAWLFSLVSAFSHFSDEICFFELRRGLGGYNFSTNKKQAGSVQGRPYRVCSVSGWLGIFLLATSRLAPLISSCWRWSYRTSKLRQVTIFQASTCTYLVISHWLEQVTSPSESQTEKALQSDMAKEGKESELFFFLQLINNSSFPFLLYLHSTILHAV